MPAATGISGKNTAKAVSGCGRKKEAAAMASPATAVAYVNHLSCSRCSPADRTSLTMTAAAPTANSRACSVCCALYAVASADAGTTVTGSCRCGKLPGKLTGESATQAMPSTQSAISSQTTGRHRGEGGRPSGNSSGISRNVALPAASSTVNAHPAHGAPGRAVACGPLA